MTAASASGKPTRPSGHVAFFGSAPGQVCEYPNELYVNGHCHKPPLAMPIGCHWVEQPEAAVHGQLRFCVPSTVPEPLRSQLLTTPVVGLNQVRSEGPFAASAGVTAAPASKLAAVAQVTTNLFSALFTLYPLVGPDSPRITCFPCPCSRMFPSAGSWKLNGGILRPSAGRRTPLYRR